MVPERIRILVVDDLLDPAESTAELLSLWGYDASACDSGAAASASRSRDRVLVRAVVPAC